ncbi:MAG: diguanylate cyclase, partial [Actinomycetota bacterium]|nr:diguanylate cyclase [Actinomycetota bacterium]
MSAVGAWGTWDGTDGGRRVPGHVLDSDPGDVHSALVPPGALHHRVTAALANWQLDDAEELLAGVERDPAPYVAADPAADVATDPSAAPGSLGRAWADTLRAELLVRRLRVAGFTLVGDPVDSPPEAAEPALDLHAGVADLLDGAAGSDSREETDPRSESASRAALAIALVRSAKAAFDATDDDVQRAAGLARHARIELLSRRIDAAMDEAVEAASLLDPNLPPSSLLVDTLGTLAGVLADLELMPLALDYQRRSHEAAVAAAAEPDALDPDFGDPAVVVATTATRLGELCAELGEGLLDDGAPDSAAPHFA